MSEQPRKEQGSPEDGGATITEEKSPRRQEKDKALIARARDRDAPSPAPLVVNDDEQTGLLTAAQKKQALFDLAENQSFMMKQSPTVKQWNIHLGVRVMRAYDRHNFEECTEVALNLIQGIRKKSQHKSKTTIGPAYIRAVILAHCYLYLAHSQRQIGGAGNRQTTKRKASSYKKAVQYATQGIHQFFAIQEWVGEPTTVYRREMADLLWLRGKTLRRTDLVAAYDDLRACIAIVRSVPPVVWNLKSPSAQHHPGNLTNLSILPLKEPTKQLHLVMAMDRVKNNSKRPFFNKKQQESIDKDFGFGIHAKDVYQCLWCGAEPSRAAGVHLKQCSRCHAVWSCGKDCFHQAWRSFHKTQCKPSGSVLTRTVVFGDGMGDYDLWAFEQHGVFFYETGGETRVGVDSRSNGDESERYFDSVSNENLVVVDSSGMSEAEKLCAIGEMEKLNELSAFPRKIVK